MKISAVSEPTLIGGYFELCVFGNSLPSATWSNAASELPDAENSNVLERTRSAHAQKIPMKSLLILPHQLFDPHPGLDRSIDEVMLVEDSLFFADPIYEALHHKQKVWLHRSSMRQYSARLKERGYQCNYIEFTPDNPRRLDQVLKDYCVENSVEEIVVADPIDFIASKRLKQACERHDVKLQVLDSPGFLNSRSENEQYASGHKRWFMADFYKWQRRRLDVLMNGEDPVGGKWSFDADNRKKIPKAKLATIPDAPMAEHGDIDAEAKADVEACFSNHPGQLNSLIYPTNHAGAAEWLDDFLQQRFQWFGDYEDAIEEGNGTLWHSVLTPMLNVGLLTPKQVLDRTLDFAKQNEVPLNSLEGFVRQVIGWREFMRATYDAQGVQMRTTNHWGMKRSMPRSLYDGTTGLPPIDDCIQRIRQTGYCHHIERLMVLGGFMFLCEIHPDAIYRWFMEMFVDSYDWVMVPNVYAMSQNADGGKITTKPYFSGSSYVRKMSHYVTGNWCEVWDGLYWRWIDLNRQKLASNARWAMMCKMAEKMDASKMKAHHAAAEAFLSKHF